MRLQRILAQIEPVTSMPERRRSHLDLAAVGLLLAGMMVALCLFSYDPADPPSVTLHPPRIKPHNLLGLPGAWVAHGLFESLGAAGRRTISTAQLSNHLLTQTTL